MSIMRNFEIKYLANLPLAHRRNLCCQHDSTLSLYDDLVNNKWQNIFYHLWMANNEPHLWPPRSPDLAVLDFSIGGRVKNVLTTKEDCILRVSISGI